MAEKMEIKVPNLGDMENVEILEVFVSPGDKISKEDPLLSLETEKAVMEIPSPANGIIESVSVSAGEKISEGDLIGFLSVQSEAGESERDQSSENRQEEAILQNESEPVDSGKNKRPVPFLVENKTIVEKEVYLPAQKTRRYHASPSVRKYARELGADLSVVKGSAPKGRITKEDVKQWIKEKLTLGNGISSGGTVSALPSVNLESFTALGPVESRSLNNIKKITGSRLQASWQNIPHVFHFEKADISELELFRKELNKKLEKEGLKVTLLSFIIMAAVKALKEFPSFNSSLSDDGASLILKKFYNIGFATETAEGLLVPVIHEAGTMGLKEITSALTDLSQRARSKKLMSREMSGGTFTISSLGGIGGTAFTPVINPPEAAIMGVSRSQWIPVWNGTEFKPRLVLPFSLSYDHRIIDGAEAARFCRFIAEILTDFRLSTL